jgi:GGDEF domain-containing protein
LSQWADRLCEAVRTIDVAVTASVGTASVQLRDVDRDRAEDMLHWLITAADGAMYAAKRSGGDRAHHHGRRPSERE